MSAKKIIGGILLVASVVLAIPTMGASLGLSAVATTLIAAGLAISASVLLGPAIPKIPGSLSNGGRERLHASLDVRAFRKFLFGKTAGATDVRYQTWTGADQEYLEMIICVASHKVNSIYELWFDNEMVWSLAGGVVSKFNGYLTITVRNEATTSNGIAIDSVWTADATLTGCAYLHVKIKLTGPDENTPGPFSNGVTSRMTVRTEGALVYDPRLDSTVSGGSGSHRAATQTTWAWSANGSRNPALVLLWYLLGWRIGSKLAVGMGLPAERIDLASFITAANICDESVALNGGGSEPRYRVDGVLSEGDDRQAVVETLCAHMNAILRDNGGKLSLHVMKNDLGSPVASFSEKDIVGACEWDQTVDLSACPNITRGQRIDPSDAALYQPVDYPAATLTSNDGIDRIDPVDYLLCQSNGQAQRLAKQRLQRAQYQGKIRFVGLPSWWQVSLGQVVQLSHQSYGWSNKLFRLVGQQITRSGQTEVVLIEEHANLYQWDNNEAAAVVPGTPTVYDPANAPTLRGIEAAAAPTTGNMLTDTLFGPKWTGKTGNVTRKKADALSGFALGYEKWYLEIKPHDSTTSKAESELVGVTPGLRYYFRFRLQRGTTLSPASAEVYFRATWYAADGSTTLGTVQIGPYTRDSVTAGAVPKEFFWSGVAPASAAFVQIRPHCNQVAGVSGFFRVEGPWIGAQPIGGSLEVGYGPTSKTIKYKADGTVESGELPVDLAYILYFGGVAQTTGVTWQYKVISGTVNGFTNASGMKSMTGSGTGTLTISSMGTDTATIEITATHATGQAKITLDLAKQFAAPVVTPGGGGGGGGGGTDSPAQTSGFTSFSGNTFVVISNELLYTIPTGKNSAVVTVNLNLQPASGADGSWTVEVKVQRDVSGTWTDQGAVFSDTSDRTTDSESGFSFGNPASVSGSRTSSSLTAGTQYKWRLVARITGGSPDNNRTHYPSGSVSVSSP